MTRAAIAAGFSLTTWRMASNSRSRWPCWRCAARSSVPTSEAMRSEEQTACALCFRKEPAPLVRSNDWAFCAACVVALGRFAAGPSRAKIWTGVGPPADRLSVIPFFGLVEEELRATLSRSVEELSAQTVEQVFNEITQGLAGVVESPETHLDLAIAYAEMGVLDDSLAEAALALQQAPRLAAGRAIIAVKLLLDPRAMRVGVDEALALIREASFAN